MERVGRGSIDRLSGYTVNGQRDTVDKGSRKGGLTSLRISEISTMNIHSKKINNESGRYDAHNFRI